MLNVNEAADVLSRELSKYGKSELSYPRSLFSGKPSGKANVSGSMNNIAYKVMMFEASNESGLPSISAQFSLNINGMGISEGQMAFWNSDNRFTKIYRQDEDEAFLVFDSFLPSTEEVNFYQSTAKIWSMAVSEIRKLKSSCERRGIF